MVGPFTFGFTKFLFAAALTAAGVYAGAALKSEPAQPPGSKCPCSCDYYAMCSGPPMCLCMDITEN